ncbi:hypothetical protein EYF80_007175 [Liparis tanakae]|uniref:Uncharacterized protein n=1 Tax=Liparis tanakae TaxID=230148 RepID=A0A4Z2IY06_9TELE|nr:hypothetical protein EYF80_007175 [Liparis tanakae]
MLMLKEAIGTCYFCCYAISLELAKRSRDSSRTEESRSEILIALLEKMELEVEVKVGRREATGVAFEMMVCVDISVERQGWDMEITEKSVSSSEGILQMG